jgi:simple sugar transport system ATP-binding protein
MTGFPKAASREASILLEATGVSKSYGGLQALSDVSITVRQGHVTCLLGDNGAGKSTFIKVLSGVTKPDAGAILLDGEEVHLNSPRDAIDRGIATVFQDLAVVGIMPVFRNFFIGHEPTRGIGPFRWFDVKGAQRVARQELERMGIEIDDIRRPIETLSGGQRQCVAIARAVHFGARVLILDEPTSALGVNEAETVLQYIMRAKRTGIGVILITHNVHHAFPVGDYFVVLRRGALEATLEKEGLTVPKLERHMAGAEELDKLQADLASMSADPRV